MSKFRSQTNFATQYSSFKQGYSLGIENAVFLKEEAIPGAFNAPSIPTQGVSTGAVGASEDISSSTGSKLKISVDGGKSVDVVLTRASGTSPAEIAAELEAKINTALGNAGQDGRVWVGTAGSLATRQYLVHSQKCGKKSAVVVRGADVANEDIADDLKLGLANGGTETSGTEGTDFLYMTKAGLKLSQDFEQSKHRAGRQPTGFIRKKRVLEGDVELYVNFDTESGSPRIDPAVALLLEAAFGRKTTTASEIRFDMGAPHSKYFSLVQCNNVFGRAATGMYVKSFSLSLPGDGEASIKMPLKGRDAKECSIGKLEGAVTGSATIVLKTGEAGRFEKGARVMCVDADGRTVVAGADGSLTVSSVAKETDSVTVSTPVTVQAGGFLVPWLPIVFGATGINNPVTGLQGSVSFDGGLTTVEEIRSVEVSVDSQLEDLDGYYGADGNRGFVEANVCKIDLKIEFNLSASQYQRIVATKAFEGCHTIVVLGDNDGRHLEIDCPKVIFKVPAIELPDSGSVPCTLEGQAFATSESALDAISLTYR